MMKKSNRAVANIDNVPPAEMSEQRRQVEGGGVGPGALGLGGLCPPGTGGDQEEPVRCARDA